MKKKLKITAIFLILSTSTLIMTSCARQISSDIYSSRQVGEVATTYVGMIRNVREICVEHGEQLGDNGLGVVGGGVAGGAVGNAFGRGDFLPTAAGAIVGAVAGSFAEKKLKQQLAYEYIVELENGGLLTVVQGRDCLFTVGQPVYVLVSSAGRSRITAQ